ncbi:MAG: hypothetical protein NTW19_03530 [Planctomycetota bacterium]|nr:hypothetical protein [Planctomycetota bacterium]
MLEDPRNAPRKTAPRGKATVLVGRESKVKVDEAYLALRAGSSFFV